MKPTLLSVVAIVAALCLPADARLVGHVVGPGGRRAGHASVTLRHARGRRGRMHPVVDAAGRFALSLNPGGYRISASHHAMGSGHVATTVAPGGITNIVVPLSGHSFRLLLPYQRYDLGVHHHLTATAKVTKANSSGSKASVSKGVAPAKPAPVAPKQEKKHLFGQ